MFWVVSVVETTGALGSGASTSAPVGCKQVHWLVAMPLQTKHCFLIEAKMKDKVGLSSSPGSSRWTLACDTGGTLLQIELVMEAL